MFDFGFGELLLLGVIALVVLGPERLPVAARLLGRWIRGARNQWNAVKAELENEIADDELRRNLREAADALRSGGAQLRDVHDGLADAAGQMTRIAAMPAATALVDPVANPAAESSPAAPANGAVLAPAAAGAGMAASPVDTTPPNDPRQLSLLDEAPASGDDRPHRDG